MSVLPTNWSKVVITASVTLEERCCRVRWDGGGRRGGGGHEETGVCGWGEHVFCLPEYEGVFLHIENYHMDVCLYLILNAHSNVL